MLKRERIGAGERESSVEKGRRERGRGNGEEGRREKSRREKERGMEGVAVVVVVVVVAMRDGFSDGGCGDVDEGEGREGR